MANILKGCVMMSEIIKRLNSPLMYLISGTIILFVVIFSTVFMVRAYKAGIAMGMDSKKLKRTITSSATFTLLPSVSILLGVIALSGSLGVPLPWLRLSVIGALHYETSVADIAARSVGLTGLSAEEMTAEAFTTIALLMAVGIIWGCILMVIFGKTYSKRFTKGNKKSGKKGFGDDAMTAMFVGLISAYIGSYLAEFLQFSGGKFVFTGDFLQLIALFFSALAMAVCIFLSEKKNIKWLDDFSIAGSMLVGMGAVALCGVLF